MYRQIAPTMEVNISSITILICNLVPCVVCIIAAPLGFFLCWRTQMNAPIYALSLQVRLQIFVWTLNTSNMLFMTLYTLYFWATPDDNESPWDLAHRSWLEMVLQRVKSPEINVNKFVIFTTNGLYMMITHACTLSVTFIMIDRCFALLYPVYYTERTKLYLLRVCLFCIISWTIYSLVSMLMFDWDIFVNAKCYNVYCSLPVTITPLLYFKCIMTIINLNLAILFCWLMWRRSLNKMVLQSSSHYFAQRANMIALWSVLSEFMFNTLPIYTLGVSIIFQINTTIPIYGQFIATGVALDGLFTILLYIKIIILKRHRVVINKISDFAVKFHHGFRIRNGNDTTSSNCKPHLVI